PGSLRLCPSFPTRRSSDLEELLEPHRSYLRDLQSLDWKAAAHVTGGGLPGNVARVLPEGLAARFDLAAWPRPPIFDLIARRGRVDRKSTRLNSSHEWISYA